MRGRADQPRSGEGGIDVREEQGIQRLRRRRSARGQNFYGETLGLDVAEDPPGLLKLRIAGGTNILAYPKPDHTPASFTILNFPVDDIHQAVDELTKRGVSFERYEGFEQDEKGIARAQGRPGGPADRVVQGPRRQHPRRARRVR
jgi:hypothetical protein